MQDFALQALHYMNNVLGTSVSGTQIGDSHQNILINLTAAKTLSRMTGIGLDASWSLGEFRIDKGEGSNNQVTQMKWHSNEARMELDALLKNGRHSNTVRFGIANG